jgi:hypothetical protein
MKTLPTHSVRARRFYYGPKEETSIVFLGTLTECKAWIKADDAKTYRTAPNESGRWALKIVRTNQLRPYALLNAERKFEEQSWL